jgi:hypothetical protein
MTYWEIIANNLSKAGWSWGCVPAIDSQGQTIWIVDAHCGDGKRYVVRADEKADCVYGTPSGDSRSKSSTGTCNGRVLFVLAVVIRTRPKLAPTM